MKKQLFLIATLAAGSAIAQTSLNQLPIDKTTLDQIAIQKWSDPAFIDAFIGSYAPLQALEPEFTNEEKIVIKEELLPLLQGNNPMAALPTLQELAKKGDASAQISFLMGNIYLQNNRTAQAEQAYKDAIKKFPNYLRAWKNLSLIYVTSGRAELAIEPVSKTIELGEATGQMYGILGVAFMQKEDYLQAESAFRNALLLEPDEKNWKLNLFQTMMFQERYEESNALLKTLIASEPNNPDYWKYQANVYVGLEKPLAAAEVLEIRDRMGKSDAQSLEMLGSIYFNSQLFDVAYDVYKRAIESGGARYDALFQSTNALAAVGRYDEAMDLISRLRDRFSSKIDSNKDDRLDLLVLEASCLRATDQVDQAAEILEKIVIEDPMNGRALIELGLYYVNLDTPDYTKAQTMFQRAQNVTDYADKAYVEEGKLLVKMRKYRDAARALRRAQEIKYSDNVQDYLDRVEAAVRRG